jgi:hypothetical protein
MDLVSYDDIRKKFQAIAGLATLDATDEFFFKNSLNSRLRDAWHRFQWPILLNLEEKTLSSTTTSTFAIGSIDEDIYEVYDKHPYVDRTARRLNYTLLSDELILDPSERVSGSIFILKKKKFTDYEPGATDIPRFFENYITSAVLSDFYRGDGQADLANVEDNRAEEFLTREIDRVERLQLQNKPVVMGYNPLSQTRISQV